MGLLLAVVSLSATLRAEDKDKKDKDSHHAKLEIDNGSVEFKSGKPNAEKLGLKVYPGATAKNEDNDSGADLSLTSSLQGDLNGSIRLHVMKFASADPSANLIAFYKKELAKYGKVIECRGGVETNFDGKSKGKAILTCDEHANKDKDSLVLKAGTENNQHVVAITTLDKGTEFSILHLEVKRGGQHETL